MSPNNQDKNLEKLILEKLKSLNIIKTRLIDESHKHIGHKGVRERGGRHYHLILIIKKPNKPDQPDCFYELSLLKQHQRIYNLLGDLIGREIHALKISIEKL